METQGERPAHPLAGPKIVYPTSTMDPKERFYRHFQDTVVVLQDQIEHVQSTSNVGGERQAAIDHVLAGISKLQNEVGDAAEFTPSYDRRQYAESIKALHERLNGAVAKVAPKSRFQFKRTAKTNHVDMGAPENDPRLNPGSFSRNPHAPQTQLSVMEATEAEASSSAVNEGDDSVSELQALGVKNYNEEMAKPSDSSYRKPSFSASREIGISHQKGLHIILPSSASRATAAGSLTDLQGCVVDMSKPTARDTPFPGLALKDISKCLVVAGRVNGPVHMTGVTDSIVVVTARQVRIHECKNVDVYLYCGSHPIIEDCSGMRFAPLPSCYMTEREDPAASKWDQVDDFKWLKAGPSPNWSILSDVQRFQDEIWMTVVPGQPGVSVRETLESVGISR